MYNDDEDEAPPGMDSPPPGVEKDDYSSKMVKRTAPAAAPAAEPAPTASADDKSLTITVTDISTRVL